MPQIYDEIGSGYAQYRRPDPRIADSIRDALGGADTVVNVGAGTGSYEPEDRPVLAVEPSRTMVRQRPPGSAPVVRGSATDLPLRDGAFGASLAILTLHHWPDRRKGLAELLRVARQTVVLLTWDPEAIGFWLANDYLPEIAEIDRRLLPSLDEVFEVLGDAELRPLPVPHDCIDGFLGAYWRRPHAYLDAGVRGAISVFSMLRDVDSGLSRLRADLEDGTWERRYGALLGESELDLGYRLVIAEGGLAG